VDAKTGKVSKVILGHTNSVTAVAFTSNGTQLVSGSVDNQVILWDASTGKSVRAFHSSVSPASAPVSKAAPSLNGASAPSLNGGSAFDPTAGPGGPILVITTASDPFSTYYTEILRNEGLNEFATADIATVTAATLGGYDVVVLATWP